MSNNKRRHLVLRIKNGSTSEPLMINIYRKKVGNNGIVVMIGGFGDDRNAFKNICHGLIETKSDTDVCSYSIRGLETDKSFPVFQQILDLQEVLDLLLTRGYQNIKLVSTSMGSIAMTAVLVDKKYKEFISSGIYLDPADYYLKFDVLEEPETWSGYKKYEPTQPTVSTLLKNLDTNVKISVVSFALKNCVEDKYFFSANSERGVDIPKGHSRLSIEMTKSFFENTPSKNKGRYIENKTLPHGFERDGDVNRNESEILGIIINLLK
jgi:hypothetical protein